MVICQISLKTKQNKTKQKKKKKKQKKKKKKKKHASEIYTLRENGTLKTDTNRFQSAFARESNDEIPSKGTRPFTAMGEMLNNLNIHKAPGPDGLSARVLKECSSEIAPVLTYIFNESLAQGAVPDECRPGIYGEKYDAAYYRPVSLTCICCKTLMRIIVSNINTHLAMGSEVKGLAKPS